MNTNDSSESTLPAAVRIPDSGLLLDLGAQSRADMKELRQGHGRLYQHIATIIDGVRNELAIPADAEVVPVVLLYRRADQANGDYTVLKIDRS